MTLEEVAEGGRVPAEDDTPRLGRLGEERIEAVAECLGPGDDDRVDGVELQGGPGHQHRELGGGTGHETDAAFLKESGAAGEARDGMRAVLHRRGGSPLGCLLMIGSDDHDARSG